MRYLRSNIEVRSKAEIFFQVKNYWKETKSPVFITFKLHYPFKLSKTFTFKEGFSEGETKDIKFPVAIDNESLDSRFQFSVTIEHKEKIEGPFYHEVDIYKSFKNLNSQDFSKVHLPYEPQDKKDFDSFNFLLEHRRSLKRFHEPLNPSSFPTYFLTRNTKEGLKVLIWSFEEKDRLELKEVLIPHLTDDRNLLPPQFIKADFNFDGKKDFLIKGLVEVKGEDMPYVQYSFFDHNFEPLFKGLPEHWKKEVRSQFFARDIDSYLLLYDPGMLFFPIKIDDPEMNMTYFNSPVFLKLMRPFEKDSLPHPDDDHLNTMKNSIFYLHPEIKTNQKGEKEVLLYDRIVDSYKFRQTLRQKIKAIQDKNFSFSYESKKDFDLESPFVAVDFIKFFPQNTNQEMKALLAVGKGYNT